MTQTLTLHLPDSVYKRLVDLAQQSSRPLEEETVSLIHSALMDVKLEASLSDRLNQLALLTDEELWNAAQTQASEDDNNLMQDLLDKQQRQHLGSEEVEQIQQLSKHFNDIMMLRAKSAVLLAQRGYDISSSDEVYADLQHKASEIGISITEWIVTILSRQDAVASRVVLSPEQQEQARQKFKGHAGAISLGYATGTNNEAIDADLAQQF